MTEPIAAWLTSLGAGRSCDSTRLIAVVSGTYALVTVNDTLARLLGAPAPAALVGTSLRAACGPTSFDTEVGARLERAWRGDVVHARHTVELPRGYSRTVDSLMLPLPEAADGSPRALWVATDVSRASRLAEGLVELAGHAAEARLSPSSLARTLADAAASGAVEVWELGRPGDPAQRAARADVRANAGARAEDVGLRAAAFAVRRGELAETSLLALAGGVAVAVRGPSALTGILFLEGSQPGDWSAEERAWILAIASLWGRARTAEAAGKPAVGSRLPGRAQLGALARGMGHDLNNVLVGILGGLELAFQDAPAASLVRRDLELIQQSADRATGLCHALLAYAGGRKGRREVLALNDLVREAAEGLAEGTVQLELDDALPPLTGDPDALRRILGNLLQNATQALEGDAARVRLCTGSLEAGRVASEFDGEGWALPPDPDLAPDRYQWLSVEDRGCGMSPEVLARAFEPFFTTRAGSSGLGLAAVLGLVESVSGAIHVRSTSGRGTRVCVLLPAP